MATPAVTKTRTAAVYARVSTDEQVDGTSLNDQIRRTRARAESEGWIVADQYVDEGISGAKPLEDRPAGARLLADIAAGKVDAVLVLKVDRLTRSLRHGSALLGDWAGDQNGDPPVAFVSVGEDFNTATPTGRLMLNLLMVFAEFERERLAERMLDGRLARVRESAEQSESGRPTRWIGGQLPIGLTSEEGAIVPDPDQAPNVVRIFELRGLGRSTTEIARELNAEGRRTRPRKGEPGLFSDDIAAKVLGDADVYLGEGVERKVGRETFTFETPPLIDRVTAAQAANYQPSKVIVGRGERRYRYALTSRVYHDHGEGDLAPMWGRKRAGRLWYRCSGSIPRAGFETNCGGDSGHGFGTAYGQVMTAVQRDYVEAMVAVWLVDFIRSDKAVEAALRNAREQAVGKDIAADPRALRAKLGRTEAKRARIIEDRQDGVISKDERDEKLADLKPEIEALEAQLAELERRTVASTGFNDAVDRLRVEKGLTRLRNEALAAIDAMAHDRHGRAGILPENVSAKVASWTQTLGIQIVLSEGEDARRPRVVAYLNPLSLSRSSASRTGCPGRSETASLPAATGRPRSAC